MRYFFFALAYCALISNTASLISNFPSLCNNTNTCICSDFTESGDYRPEVRVYCAGNEFVEIPDDNYTHVTHLDFTSNNIKELESANVTLQSDFLLTLKLSFNNIAFISGEFFMYTPNLQELYLDHNSFNTLDTYTFKGLSSLKVLDLSFNNIGTFSLNIFAPLVKLEFLNLGNNFLRDYLMGASKNGGFFGAAMGVTPNLTGLNLDNLGLYTLPPSLFENVYQLESLSLADNNLVNIPAIPYSVKYFDFSGNHVNNISAMDLPYHSLISLRLERMMNLTSIEDYAFYNVQKLENLSVANNIHLMNVSPMAFGILLDDMNYTLKTLSLKGCRIQKLHSNYSTLFSSMESADLTFNPWKCDCELEWIKKHKKILIESENIVCTTPSKIMDKSFLKTSKAECDNDDSRTVQKILLPILSVLIISLVGLIAYLIYMGPFNYNRRIGIGRSSPYNNILINE